MRLFTLPAIITLGLLLRVVFAIAIYRPSLVPYHGGDYLHYRINAQAILDGDLAFAHDGFLYRPPLFPLLVAALEMQPLLIIALNILLGTAIIPLSFALTRLFRMSRECALLASAIVAIDLTSVNYSGGVMVAEPLANLLLIAAFVFLLKLWNAGDWRAMLIWGFLAGTFILLSALTRPAAYLLWIPMALWVIFSRKGGLAGALAVVLSASLLYGMWSRHNAIYFDNESFSSAGTWNMLYVRAASVLFNATGRQDLDVVVQELASRVEGKLGNDADNISAEWRHRHWSPSRQVQAAMDSTSLGVFLEYPQYFLLTIPPGLYRSLLNLFRYPAWLAVSWNLAFLVMAGYGLWLLMKQRNWARSFFLLLPCVYFLTGTLLVNTSIMDARARVMVTPLLAVMAAYGIMHIVNRRRAASASPSPPADN